MLSPPEGDACSLGAQELRRRLAAIQVLGRSALTGRSEERGIHRLRFRAGEPTRRALERIVAAERECCPQLELTIKESGGELVLSIAAPTVGEEAAAELAAAFERGPDGMPSFRPIPIDPPPG